MAEIIFCLWTQYKNFLNWLDISVIIRQIYYLVIIIIIIIENVLFIDNLNPEFSFNSSNRILFIYLFLPWSMINGALIFSCFSILFFFRILNSYLSQLKNCSLIQWKANHNFSSSFRSCWFLFSVADSVCLPVCVGRLHHCQFVQFVFMPIFFLILCTTATTYPPVYTHHTPFQIPKRKCFNKAGIIIIRIYI